MKKSKKFSEIIATIFLFIFANFSFSSTSLSDVIWEGTQTSKAFIGSKKKVLVKITTGGVELDGKFYKPTQLTSSLACAYGMSNFPELNQIYIPKYKSWDIVLSNIGYNNCSQLSYDFRRANNFNGQVFDPKSNNQIATSKIDGRSTHSKKVNKNFPLINFKKFSEFRKLEFKVDGQIYQSFSAFNQGRGFIGFKANGILFYEDKVCSWTSRIFNSKTKTGSFKVNCPDNIFVNGNYTYGGENTGSSGSGTDNKGRLVTYVSYGRGSSNRAEIESFYHRLQSGSERPETIETKPIQANSKAPTDTQTPSITIASTSSNDRRGAISGTVKDNAGVAELRVDGEVFPLKPDGSFEWQGFIPAGGKSVVIEAIDTAGLSSMQQVRLERGQQNRVAEPSFAELNPFRGKAAKKNRNALALIVGVSDYERTPDPAIYADKDAQYFHDYAAVKLGVPDNNIFTMINKDADRVEIKKAVKNWLLRMSVKDKTDVYVFFAGHGLASSDGSNMFLLPYDGDPELLEDSAIDRKQLFADIQAISPRSVTVFLDSCYSGGTRAGGTLVASLRPITIRTKEQNIPDGFTVLSAAKGDQTSQSLEEAKHGLFSYFLMRGLEGDADANNDNQITAGELHNFVTDKVERQSGFRQTPDLQGDAERVLVRFE